MKLNEKEKTFKSTKIELIGLINFAKFIAMPSYTYCYFEVLLKVYENHSVIRRLNNQGIHLSAEELLLVKEYISIIGDKDENP